MKGLVQEIQKDIIENKNITDILRKALILAKKLHIKELEIFVMNELNGYNKPDNIPEYRNICGYQIVGWNPYHGRQPCVIDNNELFKKATNSINTDSISEIYQYVESDNGIALSLSSETYSKLFQSRTEYRLNISKSEFIKIIDAVKNELLEICLKLEEEGITGEGISFSKEEIEKVSSITNIFHGPVNGSQLQQNTQNSEQIYNKGIDIKEISNFTEDLIKSIESLKLKTPNDELLIIEAEKIQKESKKKLPNESIINEGLKTIKTILEGVTGNMLYQGIIMSMSNL